MAEGPLLNDFPAPDHPGEFLTPDHHRVLGNLTRPRSIEDLVDVLARHETPHTSARARTTAGVTQLLSDLEDEGLVAKLGAFHHEDPQAAAQAVVDLTANADDVPELHPEAAALYVARAARWDAHPFPVDEETGERVDPGEELWYWTELGAAKLRAPTPRKEIDPETGEARIVPDTRRLTGVALQAARRQHAEIEEHNRRVTAENRRLAREAAERYLAELDDDDEETT